MMKRLTAPAMLLTLGAILGTAHQADAAMPPSHAHPAAHRTTVASPAPTTAAGYAQAFAQLDPSAYVASDGFSTIPLPGGRVLWTSGDTFTDHSMQHSSFVLQSGGDFRALPGQPIPNGTAGDVYWPGHGVVEHGLLSVAAGHIRPKTGGWDNLGLSVARFTLDPSGTPTWVSTTDLGTLPGGVAWGKAIVTCGAWRYVLGTKAGAWFGLAVYAARYPVSTGSLAAPATWQYWTGTGWSASSTIAAPVISSGANGTEDQLSAWHDGAGWHIVSKRNGSFGDAIAEWSAPTVVGPWATPVNLSTGWSWAGTVQHYNAQAHPEVTLPDGRILVTIANADTAGTPADILANPGHYRPTFLALGK